MYTTPLAGRFIIDDSNAKDFAAAKSTPDGMSRGYQQRDWDAHPLGSFCAPFALPEIPESEWRERVEEKQRRRATPKFHKALAGFDSLDQNGTNYCWINAIIAGMHYARAMNGLPHVALSPASVGAPLKGYRNVGGWGSQGAKYAQEHGVCPQSLWPANGISKKYDTAEAREARKNFIICEFYELKPNDFGQVATALLNDFTVAVGLSWWGHEVLETELVATPNGDFGTDIDNSWNKRWGNNGHAILNRSKSTPDDAVAIRLVSPTVK
jgi:hypothetical protein